MVYDHILPFKTFLGAVHILTYLNANIHSLLADMHFHKSFEVLDIIYFPYGPNNSAQCNYIKEAVLIYIKHPFFATVCFAKKSFKVF